MWKCESSDSSKFDVGHGSLEGIEKLIQRWISSQRMNIMLKRNKKGVEQVTRYVMIQRL